jgi:hypothetical protein
LIQQTHQALREISLMGIHSRPGHLRHRAQLLLDSFTHGARRDPSRRQATGSYALGILQQCGQEMGGIYALMIAARGQILRPPQGLLRLLGQLVEIHDS